MRIRTPYISSEPTSALSSAQGAAQLVGERPERRRRRGVLPLRGVLAQLRLLALLGHGLLADADAPAGRIDFEDRDLDVAADRETPSACRASRSTPVSANGIRPVRPGARNTNTPNFSWRSTLPVTIAPGAIAPCAVVALAARDVPSSTSATPMRFCARSMLRTSNAAGGADRHRLGPAAGAAGGRERRDVRQRLRCLAPARRRRRTRRRASRGRCAPGPPRRPVATVRPRVVLQLLQPERDLAGGLVDAQHLDGDLVAERPRSRRRW